MAEEAVRLLSTAIAELIEDVHPEAVLMAYTHGGALAGEMRALGKDVVKLAGAMEVLHRRCGADRRPAGE